jgi:hypothetical protein
MGINPEYIDSYNEKCDKRILPGSLVKVYRHERFINDKVTPVNMLMKEAIVLKRYGEKCFLIDCEHIYPDLVDVNYLEDGYISKGHFTDRVEFIK